MQGGALLATGVICLAFKGPEGGEAEEEKKQQ